MLLMGGYAPSARASDDGEKSVGDPAAGSGVVPRGPGVTHRHIVRAAHAASAPGLREYLLGLTDRSAGRLIIDMSAVSTQTASASLC
jgi:hypothetical protein